MTARLVPLADRVPPNPIADGVRIGHVHLKVADLDRALSFYRDVLGFELTQRRGRRRPSCRPAATTTTSALNTWESLGGSPPPPGTTGLYHVAILYPTRALLADALRRMLAAGIELDGASDHGVSEALYLRDYDENGVELYWDRPRELWPVGARWPPQYGPPAPRSREPADGAVGAARSPAPALPHSADEIVSLEICAESTCAG